AVLDWELAHLGDPMEDLAWLSLRAAQETFPDFPARLTEYEHHSGRPVDRDRLRYHRVFAQLRVLILRHRAHGQPNPNGDIGNGLLSAGLHRRLFVEALADVTGTVLVPPPLPEAPEAPRDWLFEAAIVQLRDIVVPGSADGLAKSRAKGIARVLKYLRNADRLGTLVAEEDRADLESLLGSPVPSTADGHGQLALCLRSGDLDDGEVLRVLGRIIARETHLLRPAMGALADRRHPPLEDS
ncbi:MAG: phosphotransferase family protein, partial [Acidimicrobiia bacterium]